MKAFLACLPDVLVEESILFGGAFGCLDHHEMYGIDARNVMPVDLTLIARDIDTVHPCTGRNRAEVPMIPPPPYPSPYYE